MPDCDIARLRDHNQGRRETGDEAKVSSTETGFGDGKTTAINGLVERTRSERLTLSITPNPTTSSASSDTESRESSTTEDGEEVDKLLLDDWDEWMLDVCD